MVLQQDSVYNAIDFFQQAATAATELMTDAKIEGVSPQQQAFLIGQAACEVHEYAIATYHLTSSFQLEERHQAAALLAICAWRSNQLKEAKSWIKRAIAIKRDGMLNMGAAGYTAAYHAILAAIEFAMGQTDSAISTADVALKLSTNDVIALRTRAQAYFLIGEFDAAINDLEKAIAHAPPILTKEMAENLVLVEQLRDYPVPLVMEGFLDADLCTQLRIEASSAHKKTAKVIGEDGRTEVIREKVRKTRTAHVNERTQSIVTDRLMRIKPELESHFDVELTGCQALNFLVYKKGDYFRPHHDNRSELDCVNERQISTVIFLNDAADDPGSDTYCGGTLVFYGLTADARWRQIGFPVKGETGMLVAFRSETIHGVQEVTSGERYAIVNWFY